MRAAPRTACALRLAVRAAGGREHVLGGLRSAFGLAARPDSGLAVRAAGGREHVLGGLRSAFGLAARPDSGLAVRAACGRKAWLNFVRLRLTARGLRPLAFNREGAALFKADGVASERQFDSVDAGVGLLRD